MKIRIKMMVILIKIKKYKINKMIKKMNIAINTNKIINKKKMINKRKSKRIY